MKGHFIVGYCSPVKMSRRDWKLHQAFTPVDKEETKVEPRSLSMNFRYSITCWILIKSEIAYVIQKGKGKVGELYELKVSRFRKPGYKIWGTKVFAY